MTEFSNFNATRVWSRVEQGDAGTPLRESQKAKTSPSTEIIYDLSQSLATAHQTRQDTMITLFLFIFTHLKQNGHMHRERGGETATGALIRLGD